MGENAWLTVEQARAYLPLNRTALYQAIARGEVPGVVRFGKRIFISRRVLERLAEGEQPSRERAPTEVA